MVIIEAINIDDDMIELALISHILVPLIQLLVDILIIQVKILVQQISKIISEELKLLINFVFLKAIVETIS